MRPAFHSFWAESRTTIVAKSPLESYRAITSYGVPPQISLTESAPSFGTVTAMSRHHEG
jgi:hypothetical protein